MMSRKSALGRGSTSIGQNWGFRGPLSFFFFARETVFIGLWRVF